MTDIRQSLQRALVEQGWVFGDKCTRLGNPFEWTENQKKSNILDLQDSLAIRFYFTLYYVKCATTDEVWLEEHDQVLDYCEKKMWKSFKHFFPFMNNSADWTNYIESQALVRTQDYCFIKKHCPKLSKKFSHLDIGPGLGSSAIFSLKFFDSNFYALEASEMSYGVQREFFRHLSPNVGDYLDVIECENFNLSTKEIERELNENSDYRIKHVPSWKFQLVAKNSIDLVTAGFVFNELNHSGILWMLANASRILRKGGYLYIRDSYIMKHGQHNIDYDQVLLNIGFERKALLEVANRHDVYGIPRVFEKMDDSSHSFDDMVDLCLGKYASVASGGEFAYNYETTPQYNKTET